MLPLVLPSFGSGTGRGWHSARANHVSVPFTSWVLPLVLPSSGSGTGRGWHSARANHVSVPFASWVLPLVLPSFGSGTGRGWHSARANHVSVPFASWVLRNSAATIPTTTSLKRRAPPRRGRRFGLRSEGALKSPYSLGVVSGVARLFAWKRPTLLRRVDALPCGGSLSGSVALAALRCCQCARPLHTRHKRASAGFLAPLLRSRPVAPAPPLKSGVCPCLHLCRKRQLCKHRQHYFSASPPPRGTQSRSAGNYAPALPSVGVGGSRVVLRSGATRSLWCSLLFCVLAPLPRAFAVTGKRGAFLRFVCLALPRAVVSLCAWATRAVALGAPFLSASPAAVGVPLLGGRRGPSPFPRRLPRFRRASPSGRACAVCAGFGRVVSRPKGRGVFFGWRAPAFRGSRAYALSRSPWSRAAPVACTLPL